MSVLINLSIRPILSQRIEVLKTNWFASHQSFNYLLWMPGFLMLFTLKRNLVRSFPLLVPSFCCLLSKSLHVAFLSYLFVLSQTVGSTILHWCLFCDVDLASLTGLFNFYTVFRNSSSLLLLAGKCTQSGDKVTNSAEERRKKKRK